MLTFQSQTKSNQNGVQSFLKWFKKKEATGLAADIRIERNQQSNVANKPQFIDDDGDDDDDSTTDTLSVPSSPSLSLSSLSSRGSIQSTDTTGFAFIPLDQYNPFGNVRQVRKK